MAAPQWFKVSQALTGGQCALGGVIEELYTFTIWQMPDESKVT